MLLKFMLLKFTTNIKKIKILNHRCDKNRNEKE